MSTIEYLLQRICTLVERPLAVVDAAFEVVEANSRFGEALGVDATQIRGSNIFDLPDGRWNGAELRQLVEQGVPTSAIVSTPDFDWSAGQTGNRRACVNVCQVRDAAENNGVLLLLWIHEQSERPNGPVVERQESTQQLREVKDASGQASRAKNQFLANISHELRTPMTAILGMLQLSLQEDVPKSVRDYLNTAKDSANALLTLLNDILDYAGLESGNLTIITEPFGLRELLDQCVAPHAVLAQSKGLRWKANVYDEVPDKLVGDSVRLRQVVNHLLENAVKFTERGGVDIQVALDQHQPAEGVSLLVSVSDTGPGLSTADQVAMLEGFTQLDASSTRRHGGAGLGLAICRALVERVGGRLNVISQFGHGSTVQCTVPFAIQDTMEQFHGEPEDNTSAPSNDRQPETSSRLSVLLAEDTPANQKVIGNILRKRGHAVTVAANGREALEIVAKEHFDAILMDLQMPVMDGYQAAAAIQELERRSGTHTPIIALTAHSTERDRTACLQAGMDAYLAKPIDVAKLTATVESIAHAENDVPVARKKSRVKAHAAPATSIDIAATLHRLGGDEELFRQFIVVFSEDAPRLLHQLSSAIAKGDCEAAARTAHTMRGLAANFSATSVVELASQIEGLAKNHDLAEINGLSRQLSNAVSDVKADLDAYCQS